MPGGEFRLSFLKALFLIWGDDAGKLFLPLPTHIGNRAFLRQNSETLGKRVQGRQVLGKFNYKVVI